MPILNKKYETLSHDELVQVQLERLQQTLSRVYRRVSYYHNLFNKIEFDPFEISDLEDLKKIPFTTKDTLRLAYPFDMFAVPLREVVRMHSTSGTTGQPLVVGYTKNDIEHWTELTARILTAAGVTTDDIIQICFPYGLFTGGLGFHYGAEKIGASVIPSSESDIEHQIIIMKDYRTSALACAPSYAVGLAEVMREKGITPAEHSSERNWRKTSPYPPSTITGSLKLSAPGSPLSVKTKTASTSPKTILLQRSSTPKTEGSSDLRNRGSSSSPRSQRKHTRSSATGRATSLSSFTIGAAAGEPL